MPVLMDRWEQFSSAAELEEVSISEHAFVFSPVIDGSPTPMMPNAVTKAFTQWGREPGDGRAHLPAVSVLDRVYRAQVELSRQQFQHSRV